ncbi:DUF4932 domain-containing protein [Niabella ginsengisoli]|uniref:DUF4932 domain-containing protein n=1 Tax=Niabella ginsengisoli TaxID=522298 RepID=A0ABS9SG61_9BACT|nr:DUF4932 domain-containing protein [Niabella ginsengisoli]MCH5597354.1 DUF4932 domain-containing protein [Niabella ginsengisoli]
MISFDQKWYTAFYGTPPLENFNIIIGFSNGRANYGVRALPVNSLLDVYSIIGSSQFDSSGYPTFNSNDVEQLLTHEFNHSFVNPLLDKNINNEKLVVSAKKLFGITSEQMQKTLMRVGSL